MIIILLFIGATLIVIALLGILTELTHTGGKR